LQNNFLFAPTVGKLSSDASFFEPGRDRPGLGGGDVGPKLWPGEQRQIAEMMLMRDRAVLPFTNDAGTFENKPIGTKEWITVSPKFFEAFCSMLAAIRLPKAMNLAVSKKPDKVPVLFVLKLNVQTVNSICACLSCRRK
jgi:hypothetical protein